MAALRRTWRNRVHLLWTTDCRAISQPGELWVRNVGGERHDLLMTDPGPETDDRHPADVVTGMVDHVLDLAATWPRWDGRPIEVPAEGEPARTYTPHKAIRRVADHLVDHLAEMEARLAGRPTEPDRWHASAITTPGDLAAFTPDDLDEARSRLRRLALIWEVRLRSLSDRQLDERAGGAWALRQLAFHLAESAFYAESVGMLSDPRRGPGAAQGG
jgi:hypothetical protein